MQQHRDGAPPRPPERETWASMLQDWAGTAERALEDMISDIRAGKLYDDTLARDFDFLRHLMGRREIIVNEIARANSRHRGPGTPGYREF